MLWPSSPLLARQSHKRSGLQCLHVSAFRFPPCISESPQFKPLQTITSQHIQPSFPRFCLNPGLFLLEQVAMLSMMHSAGA